MTKHNLFYYPYASLTNAQLSVLKVAADLDLQDFRIYRMGAGIHSENPDISGILIQTIEAS